MKKRSIWAISLLFLCALVAGLYWWWLLARAPVAPARPVVQAQVPPPSAAPASSENQGIRFPVDGDANASAAAGAASATPAAANLAEALVETLGRKAVLEFLNVDAFAQRVAATVDNLPRAHAAARLWPVHPAAGRFGTQSLGEQVVITADNAKRHAAFVAWIESLDMKSVARLYRRFYPQFQRAYEELGYPGRYFNDRVIDAIDHLLATPALDGPVAVKLADIKGPIQPTRPWVMVEFADPDTEARSAGQKLLLRMGSENTRRLKAKLTELRAALTQRQ